MKKRKLINSSHGIAAAGATLFLTAAHGHAQFANNFYIGADAGGSFQQSVSIMDNTGFGGSGGDIKFQTGWNTGGYVGYKFCDYFSAQLDSGIVWNNLTVIGNQTLSGVAAAHLEEVPLLVNGIFTFPLGNFKPYAGVGVGTVFGILNGDNIPGSGPPPNPTYHDTDATFAYQVQVGLGYAVTKHIDLAVAYKFMGTTDHNWNDNNISLKTSGTMTHMLEASVTWRF